MLAGYMARCHVSRQTAYTDLAGWSGAAWCARYRLQRRATGPATGCRPRLRWCSPRCRGCRPSWPARSETTLRTTGSSQETTAAGTRTRSQPELVENLIRRLIPARDPLRPHGAPVTGGIGRTLDAVPGEKKSARKTSTKRERCSRRAPLSGGLNAAGAARARRAGAARGPCSAGTAARPAGRGDPAPDVACRRGPGAGRRAGVAARPGDQRGATPRTFKCTPTRTAPGTPQCSPCEPVTHLLRAGSPRSPRRGRPPRRRSSDSLAALACPDPPRTRSLLATLDFISFHISLPLMLT